MKAALGRAYAKAQKTQEANEMLNELNELAKRQYASAYELATIYVALGNNEEAFQLLAKAYAKHSFHLVNLNVSPQFKLVRSDPRFQDLSCSALGFPPKLRRTLASFWRTRCGMILASTRSLPQPKLPADSYFASSCRSTNGKIPPCR